MPSRHVRIFILCFLQSRALRLALSLAAKVANLVTLSEGDRAQKPGSLQGHGEDSFTKGGEPHMDSLPRDEFKTLDVLMHFSRIIGTLYCLADFSLFCVFFRA